MTGKRNVKGKVTRAAVYSRTLTRVRHYRGFGVHSPFVYGLIRNAMMKRTPEGEDLRLFDELRRRGFSKRRAAQLHNLCVFRNFPSVRFAEAPGETPAPEDGTLYFAMPSLPEEDTMELVEKASGTGCTVCFVSPYESRRRRRLARSLVSSHRHTSVDNRGFLLLFFDERLPKQHFEL